MMKNRKNTIRNILFLLLLVVSSVFVFTLFQLQPLNTNKKIVYELKENATLKEVLRELEEEKLIKNSFISYQYAKILKKPNLISGKFEISSNSTVDEILDQISDSSKLIHDHLLVTLPDGKWAIHYAQIISEKTGLNKQEILDKWNNTEYIESLKKKYWFLKDITKSEHAKVLLEGYLLGNTYQITPNMKIEEITEMILDYTNRVLSEYRTVIENQNIHDLLVKASLVQYEASSKEDMKKVAGVIENRLAKDQKLELSVTVCYSLYDALQDWKQCETNPNLDSPFNTYLHKGLPPTPINNPTALAVEATLNYEKHDFYFFVADVCGDGTVYYSKTYEEHLEKVDKYLTQKGCIH